MNGNTDAADGTAASEEGTNETIRVWMVERGYTNRDLITLVYEIGRAHV